MKPRSSRDLLLKSSRDALLDKKSSTASILDKFDDEDDLNSQSWKSAKVEEHFVTKHMKALKIGAGVSIGILFLVILIVVVASGGDGDGSLEATEWCEERKSIGLCESKNVFELAEMELKCRTTCGFSKKGWKKEENQDDDEKSRFNKGKKFKGEGKGKSDDDANCKDKRSSTKCEFAKETGLCESEEAKDVAEMEKGCKATCGFCEVESDNEVEECEDRRPFAKCMFAKNRGLCESKDFKDVGKMKRECKVTCGMCAPGTASETAAKCDSENKESDEWCEEKKHYCISAHRKNFNIMIMNCRKTCGICEKEKTKAVKGQAKGQDKKGKTEKGKKEKGKAQKGDKEKEVVNKDKDFKDAVLKRHNELRAIHEVPPMEWSEKVARFAKSWCNKLAKQKKMEHSLLKTERKGFGENLYVGGSLSKGGAVLGTSVSDLFYAEEKLYDYSKPAFQYKAGHFTTMVWKSTNEMGCSYAVNDQTYVCCNYTPQGNTQGAFEENVLPPAPKEK